MFVTNQNCDPYFLKRTVVTMLVYVAAGTQRSGWRQTRPCDTSGSRLHRPHRLRCADLLPPSVSRRTVYTEVANPANKTQAWTTPEPSCPRYCETSHYHTHLGSTDLMRQSTARVRLPLDDSWTPESHGVYLTKRKGRAGITCAFARVVRWGTGPVTDTRITGGKHRNSQQYHHRNKYMWWSTLSHFVCLHNIASN